MIKKIGAIAIVGCVALCVLAIAVPVYAQIMTGGPSSEQTTFPNPFGNDNEATKSIYGFVFFALSNIVMPIGSVIVVFFLIYSGYLFATAQGSDKKIEHAKETFFAVVIGALILLGSWTIAAAIRGTLCQIADGNIPDLCDGALDRPEFDE